ncbi:hypothetical protein BC830DRAFT_1173899 [Chytriomyces sp. MP71]|nr:hypothetical protein BC830DRAFT_1173899 [Chytriomyces sp. MP71]
MDIVRSLFFGGQTIPGRVNDPGATDAPDPVATKRPMSQSEKSVYYTKLFLFAVLWLVAPIAAVAVALPAAPLLYLDNRRWHAAYRGYVRIVERAFAAFVPITAWLFMPGSRLVITGDWDKMHASAKQVVMANHQVYPDWFYLWLLAWVRAMLAIYTPLRIYAMGAFKTYRQSGGRFA